MKIAGVDIAKLVHQNMSQKLLPAVLVKSIATGIDPDDPTLGAKPRLSRLACRGVTVELTQYEKRGDLMKNVDKKVLLIANSIEESAVPETGDRIEIEGLTYRICEGGVSRDPAAATYTCNVAG